jgi:hypothetical protein
MSTLPRAILAIRVIWQAGQQKPGNHAGNESNMRR